MAKKNYKSAEAAANVSAHWFGAKNGNPICPQKTAVQQREFYKWVEQVATLEELQAYIADKSHPHMRIRFIELFLKANKTDEFFNLTNQAHGLPKQSLEVDNKPTTINLIIDNE